VALLLGAGASLEAKGQTDGRTCLHYALESPSRLEVPSQASGCVAAAGRTNLRRIVFFYPSLADGATATWLSDKGCSMNVYPRRWGDEPSCLPLYPCLWRKGRAEVVGELLAARADVAAANKEGRTALHVAAQQGFAEVPETSGPLREIQYGVAAAVWRCYRIRSPLEYLFYLESSVFWCAWSQSVCQRKVSSGKEAYACAGALPSSLRACAVRRRPGAGRARAPRRGGRARGALLRVRAGAGWLSTMLRCGGSSPAGYLRWLLAFKPAGTGLVCVGGSEHHGLLPGLGSVAVPRSSEVRSLHLERPPLQCFSSETSERQPWLEGHLGVSSLIGAAGTGAVDRSSSHHCDSPAA